MLDRHSPREEYPVSELSIEELIQRARAGDKSALEALFERSQSLLEEMAGRRRAQIRPHVRPGLDRPSDLAQETALRAFRGFSTFGGTTEAEWRAWLRRIFQHRRDEAFRDARRQRRDVRETLSLDSPNVDEIAASQKSPSQMVAHDERWRQTLAQIFDLPDDQRDAIWLCHLEELPVTEVAQRMGKTEAAVAGLLRRGLQTLRQRVMHDASAGAALVDAGSDSAAAALLIYLRGRDAGEAVDRDTLCAEHPDCADELRAMLQWIDHIEAIRPERSRT
jgi:RNA polymerase sigma-70 factor (ECF subfamily)